MPSVSTTTASLILLYLCTNIYISNAILLFDAGETFNVTVIDRRGQQWAGKNEDHTRFKRHVDNNMSDGFSWEKEAQSGDLDVQGTEHILEGDSNNIAFVFWKHHATEVIFILTCENASTTSTSKLSNKGCHSYSNFYRSEDLGAEFNRSDKRMPFSNHWLHSIYLSPINKEFIILTDYKNKTMFITNDEGNTYKKVKPGFAPTYVLFHPTDAKIIAAFDNTNEGKQSLWVSQNSGDTWQKVNSNIKNYFWQGKAMSETETGLYFEKLERDVQRIDGHMVSSLYHYTVFMANVNAQVSMRHIISNLVQDSVYIGNEFILVEKFKDKHLYVMRPKYESRFKRIIYRNRNSKPHVHHTIISSDNTELLIGIFHPDNTVTVYLSDQTGANLYFLQDNIITEPLKSYNKLPKIDFVRVKGFTNNYIINRKQNGTLMSFNKGQTWDPLNSKDSTCDPKLKRCDLYLFLKIEEPYSDFTAPMLSKESAPGIILAQGRIGGPIITNDDIVQAQHAGYISIDAGKSWRRTLDSSYGYALLDHGNAIAATALQFTVRQEIKISINYGWTWNNVHLTHRYSRIAAIITDSTAKTLVLNVFGFLHQQPKESKVKGNQWVVWKFNFTKIIPRPCEAKDYYRYYPFGSSTKCIMGEKYSYKRNIRKRDQSTLCFSPPHHNIEPQHESCSCTYADFDCDDVNNFMPAYTQGEFKCIPIDSNSVINQKQHCDKDGFYIKTTGYCKRPGNKCHGGKEKQLTGNKTKCDVIIPDVSIKASRITLGLNDPVEFSMYQTTSSYETTYIWIFGDGHTMTGSFEYMETVQHSFNAIGHYTVQLVSKNIKGSNTASLVIVVLDKTYHNAFIDFKAPVVVNQENVYTLQRLGEDGESKQNVSGAPYTKFLWSFQGVFEGGTNSVRVPYAFQESGLHQVEVQVITPINSQTILRIVRVVNAAYLIEFRFSSYLDRLNTGTYTWLNDFLYKFRNFIVARFQVFDPERLIADADMTTPTHARLYVCDTDKTGTHASAEVLAQRIAQDINKNQPVLTGYQSADIHVQSAKLHGFVQPTNDKKTTDGTGGSNGGKKSRVWIYVLVVLIIVLGLLGLGIYVRYRSKTTSCVFTRKDKNDIMQKKLVFSTDEDCVGLEGPDLPQYRD